MKLPKMTHKTVYLYYALTEGDAAAHSQTEKAKALTLFWKKTGLEPEVIQKTSEGKPYFPSQRFHISVTHTGNLFALAIAPRPIGIDGEREAVVRPSVAERMFSVKERALPFSHVWCGKEAVAKLLGKGLSVMRKITVEESRAVFGKTGYLLRQKRIGEYILTLATEEGWDYATETLSEK